MPTGLYVATTLQHTTITLPDPAYLPSTCWVAFGPKAFAGSSKADNTVKGWQASRDVQLCHRLTRPLWANVWQQALAAERRYEAGELSRERYEALAARVWEIAAWVDGAEPDDMPNAELSGKPLVTLQQLHSLEMVVKMIEEREQGRARWAWDRELQQFVEAEIGE